MSVKPTLTLCFLGFLWISACSGSAAPSTDTAAPIIPAATAIPAPTEEPSPTPTITPIPVDQFTLDTLREVAVPISDHHDLARRIGGVLEEIPSVITQDAVTLEVGARERFTVSNQVTGDFQVEAILRGISSHVYIWIQEGVSFEQSAVDRMASAFENRIYPTNREFFGNERSPGIDGDEHVYILVARGLGLGIGGYFSSADSLHPLAHPSSNAHEMFVLNADNLELGSDITLGVLAHEFQHMIQWNHDRNETTWMSEGLAEIAAFLNGYDPGGADALFAEEPDLQLNDWPEDDTVPHYGASFLFLSYLMDRIGQDAMQVVARSPERGLASIDAVLDQLMLADPETGAFVSTDDIFFDWVITNFLHDQIANDRFDYLSYVEAPRVLQTDVIRNCDRGPWIYDVHQYAADYVRFLCEGSYTLRFEGEREVPLLPAGAYSGEFSFWSNKGDMSDMRLTRAFDLTDQAAPITLTYWTWYQIENNWDYMYLLASIDGERWEMLQPPSVTDSNPHGNNFGFGYTNKPRSSDWVQEGVDLSRFAGQQVWIRFEYVTDDAVNGEGMLVDDIQIPEIGYFTDFEQDDGGWEAEGWVRVKNVLPQTYRHALFWFRDDISIELVPTGINNVTEFPIELKPGESVVVVIAGTTRFTRQLANYTLSVEQ
jgi:hypothetical protein